MGRTIDITGNRYGRLVVIERENEKIKKEKRWLCKCDCGNYIYTYGYCLKNGHTKSCGCLLDEARHDKNIIRHKTHGMTNTRIYKEWMRIRYRCTPRCHYRKDYYDRGIQVCNEWEKSFESFYEWSIKNGYSDDLTIDRIDNDKGYAPDNCRWVDMKAQANNRRSNVMVTINGDTMTVSQWCDKLGVPQWSVKNRVSRGKTHKEAILDLINKD